MCKLRVYLNIAVLSLALMAWLALAPAPVAAQSEDMLYFVEFKATEAGAPTSREQAIALLQQLIVPSLESLATEGKVRAGGLFVGARAGVVIVAAKSHDEVTKVLRGLPAWGVWEWTVTPLESFNHRAALEKNMVKALGEKGP